MAEWFKEYWHLVIVLIAVTAVAAVIFYFAAKAYRKRMEALRKEEAEIKRLVALKEKFRPITEEAIKTADENELLEGIALAYQLKLQKEENIEEKFNLLNDDVKDIYALDVFVQDKTSKEFFSQNGDILKTRILSALKKIGMEDFASMLKPIYDMYDNSNEDVSYNEKKIAEIDEYIESQSVLSKIKLKSAEYIKGNFEPFIN